MLPTKKDGCPNSCYGLLRSSANEALRADTNLLKVTSSFRLGFAACALLVLILLFMFFSSLEGPSGKAEPVLDAPMVSGPSVAVGNTPLDRLVGPRSATQHTEGAGGWTYRVSCWERRIITASIPVPAPFRHISSHIVESVGVGCKAADW